MTQHEILKLAFIAVCDQIDRENMKNDSITPGRIAKLEAKATTINVMICNLEKQRYDEGGLIV